MRECLKLAERGKGRVSPNPLVGTVLVRGNKVVARGWHKRFGGPHAEVECLQNYKGSVRNATLYVNIEPCNHVGKTPPCVDLILERGIERVVVAMKDPNPLVSGKGIAKLKRNRVEVELGVLGEEARQLNRFFIRHIADKIPYVHLKLAQTTNGFIARNNRAMKYISANASRKLVHQWRTEYDAVLVGAGTIKADDPLLDTRLAKGRSPAVIILDGNLSVSGNERVFSSARNRRVLICTSLQAFAMNLEKVLTLSEKGAQFVLEGIVRRKLSLKRTLRKLYEANVGSILVEGGADVFSQFILANMVDELSIFIAPIKFSSGVPAMTNPARRRLENYLKEGETVASLVGRDLLIHSQVTPYH
jgi:diaminohydroxyphosphoribosylaminopyrimidine deaminase/5-amino-6-(5-phosphoribosylamino)uracil reductase